MKTFLKWFPIPAAVVLVLTVVILLIAWQPPKEDEGDFVITNHYVDSTVADSDERLVNSFVNNSANNFFIKGDQLKSQVYFESASTRPYKRSFYDYYRKRTETDAFVPRPMGRQVVAVREDVLLSSDSQEECRINPGERFTYHKLIREGGKCFYQLTDGRLLAAASAVRFCQRTPFEGTLAHPFTVDINTPQYLNFTDAGDYIYLYFSTDNEFISLFLEGLPAGSSWELYDHTYHKLEARFCEKTGEEIFYRAPAASYFLLKINASAAAEVTMRFHRDDNEWMRRMQTVTTEKKYSGIFDYYGDEDFFVLDKQTSDDIEQLVMELEGADATLQVTAYDQQKKMIGRYTREKGVKEHIVLYGLRDVYAISLRTVDGALTKSAYQLRFYYQDVDLLGLETFGFKLSAPIQTGKDGENYYTAVCKGRTGKRIVDVQTNEKTRVNMTLTTAAGAVFEIKEGQELPLGVGKNVLKINLSNPTDTRELSISITDVGSYQLGYVFITASSAGIHHQPVSGSGTFTTLHSGDKVLSTGQRQNGFLKVELVDGSGKIGWVDESRIFAEYARSSMPSAYRSALERLQKLHPNWKFTFVRVGRTLEEAVAVEQGSHPIIFDGGWRTPSAGEIRRSMDPQTYFNEQDIFAFEKQTYHEGTYSKAGVSAIWKQRDGTLASPEYYADCFMEAGKAAGLSPYFIAARAAIESGYGTSTLSKGASSGYEGYYNFYGINAVDSNPKKGAVYAKEHNWYTQRIAIVEGAVWIKDQYVSVLQYTPYFIKYSFVPGRGWHQYMTDIGAPREDGKRLYTAHRAGGTLNSEIEFVIPVYN